MEASIRQQRIYDEWRDTDKNILVEAVAGSGKTTTLLHLLSMSGKTLFLSFNNSIQKEIEGKILANNLTNAKAQTLHSFGYEIIRGTYKKIKINNNKGWDIVGEMRKTALTKSLYKYYESDDIWKYLMTLKDMWEISRIYLTRDIKQILVYAEMMDKIMKKPLEGEGKGVDYELLEKLFTTFLDIADSYYGRITLEIDFTDMIYIPVIKDLPVYITCDNVFIDECQDLNYCQHMLVDKLISKPYIKKWIAVGDRNQSIYGFTGAFSKSFDLYAQRPNVISLPLDINYRCPTKIVEHANKVYNNLVPFKTEEGSIEFIAKGNEDRFITVCRQIQNSNETGLIICRNNSPLVTVYFMLLHKDIPCFIKGDDIIDTANRCMKPYAGKTIREALNGLDAEYQNLKRTLPVDEKYKISIFEENYRIVTEFISGLKFSYHIPVNDLLQAIEKIKRQKDGAIAICSIHKSKGLEADNVILMNEELIPSKFSNSPESAVQEENLRYVARTRAKKAYYKFDLEL